MSEVMEAARSYARQYIKDKDLESFEPDPSADPSEQLEELVRRHSLYTLVMGSLEDPEKAWAALSGKASKSVLRFVDLENSRHKDLRSLVEENCKRRRRVAELRDKEGKKRYRDLYSEELEVLDAYALYALVGLLYQEDDEKAVRKAEKTRAGKIAQQAKGAAASVAAKALEDALRENPNMGQLDQENLYDEEYNAAYVRKMDELDPLRDKGKDTDSLSPKRRARVEKAAKALASDARKKYKEENPKAGKEELKAVYDGEFARAIDEGMTVR